VIFINALVWPVRAQTPATLTDLGSSPPSPGQNDLYQFSIAGQANFPDSLNYYTDNQSDNGVGEPGQTFTVPNGAPAYLLNSLAIKTGGGFTTGIGTPQGYLLHIYGVNSGTVALLATYGATNFTFADGDWLQWSGLSQLLLPNTVYAFSFGKASSAIPGYEAMGNASGNPYAGGEIGLLPVAGGPIIFGSSHNYDAVFDIGLTSTGTVSTALITNSAASAIHATSATLNGQVIYTGGSTPQLEIFYGPNDGGTNFAAWSNSVAANFTNAAFSALATGLATNTTYYFTAFASNSAGVTWAVPSQSFTTPAANPVVTRVQMLTYHNDNTRQGQNTNETLLTLATVNTNTFGK
jgi:hypothetical protein